VSPFTVVVPAHNEEAVIADLLAALQPGVEDGRMEIIVVPNGCDDETAAVARRFPVVVVERSEPGKVGALNAGDDAATGFPRFYIDGDVILTADDISDMAAELGGEVLAVAPGRRLETSGSSWAVRSYLRLWDELESTRRSLAGRGCYGVSEVGRSRWQAFPDLVADDGYVNALFAETERRNVERVESIVGAPSDLRNLVARKRRSHRGNRELEDEGHGATSNTEWLRVLRRNPRRLVDAPVYVMVTLVSRFLAGRDRRRGQAAWTTDRSSRERR